MPAHYPHLTGQSPSGPDADSCITECTTPDVRAVLVYKLLPADYIRTQGLPCQIIRIAACDPPQPYRLHVLARDILTGQGVEAVYFEDHEIPWCMSLRIPSEVVIDMFVGALLGTAMHSSMAIDAWSQRSKGSVMIWIARFALKDLIWSTVMHLTDTVDGDRLITTSDLPVRPFVPPELQKLSTTKVTAAALREGYHMVLTDYPCKIIQVNRRISTQGEAGPGCVTVAGKASFTGDEHEEEFRIRDMVVVIKYRIDAGAQSWL
ncbi:hypothetical protein OEA41_009636 [Lepraria neglecta]|uniref:Uncharacterized protein n=1 Tax=Lepraria neglecta TaxID=209136 RepID=A0AAD9Z217_9LECA|nr:hypothetical protein OEA41_009636 [Lepraria neglecta]